MYEKKLFLIYPIFEKKMDSLLRHKKIPCPSPSFNIGHADVPRLCMLRKTN
jgi:hypothetical protein